MSRRKLSYWKNSPLFHSNCIISLLAFFFQSCILKICIVAFADELRSEKRILWEGKSWTASKGSFSRNYYTYFKYTWLEKERKKEIMQFEWIMENFLQYIIFFWILEIFDIIVCRYELVAPLGMGVLFRIPIERYLRKQGPRFLLSGGHFFPSKILVFSGKSQYTIKNECSFFAIQSSINFRDRASKGKRDGQGTIDRGLESRDEHARRASPGGAMCVFLRRTRTEQENREKIRKTLWDAIRRHSELRRRFEALKEWIRWSSRGYHSPSPTGIRPCATVNVAEARNIVEESSRSAKWLNYLCLLDRGLWDRVNNP